MRPLLSLLFVAIVAGCGGSQNGRERPEETGRIVITEELPRRAIYQEGSIGYLRVAEADSGRVVFADRVSGPGVRQRRDGILFGERTPAGRYRVVSWQRPCNGNCGALGAESDRCEVVVDVGAGETARRLVKLDRRGGCTFTDPQ